MRTRPTLYEIVYDPKWFNVGVKVFLHYTCYRKFPSGEQTRYKAFIGEILHTDRCDFCGKAFTTNLEGASSL